MAGIAFETSERLLLVHNSSATDDSLASVLGAQGLIVTRLSLAGPISWPDDEFDAAVVLTDVFDSAARSTGLRLKRERPRVPLLLWSHDSTDVIEDVLDAGYDLWLPAQVTPIAVAAQVRALHRLVHAVARQDEPQMLTIRNVTIDFHRFEVRSDSGTLTLTPTEFKIIAHLARRPGKVVRHTELFREVHGYEASEQEAKDILKVHIWRLRNKLNAAGADGDCITNVRGFGYLLDRRNVSSAQDERRSALA